MAADKNLTGEQIQQIMDMLLYKALEPIILYTDEFDAQVEYLLYLITTNRKRKLTSIDRDVVLCSLASYLTEKDKAVRLSIIKSARIERFFIHAFISKFCANAQPFIAGYHEFLLNPTPDKKDKLNALAKSLANTSRHRLYKAYNIASVYITRFYDYRATVIGHYVKNVSKLAKAHTNMSTSNTSFHDLRQSIFRNTLTALDKYDSRKGALTSYINTWAKNATTTAKEHEYNIAYTIPQSQRKKLVDGTATDRNFSVSLDSLYSDNDEESLALYGILAESSMEEDIERADTVNMVQRVAKSVDPLGIARLTLDIGEYFSDAELRLMQAHTVESQ